MGSLQGAMTNMRDLTSQVTALGRQRKMTGNMSFGENFEPAIYKGLYESALGKMVDFGNLDVNQQNAATNRYNADTNRFEADTGRMAAGWTHEYQMGSLANDATRNTIYGQQVNNDYALGQSKIGLGYAELDATKAWQTGQLGLQQQQNDIDALWKAGQLTNQERDLALREIALKAEIATGKKQTEISQDALNWGIGLKTAETALPYLKNINFGSSGKQEPTSYEYDKDGNRIEVYMGADGTYQSTGQSGWDSSDFFYESDVTVAPDDFNVDNAYGAYE